MKTSNSKNLIHSTSEWLHVNSLLCNKYFHAFCTILSFLNLCLYFLVFFVSVSYDLHSVFIDRFWMRFLSNISCFECQPQYFLSCVIPVKLLVCILFVFCFSSALSSYSILFFISFFFCFLFLSLSSHVILIFLLSSFVSCCFVMS